MILGSTLLRVLSGRFDAADAGRGAKWEGSASRFILSEHIDDNICISGMSPCMLRKLRWDAVQWMLLYAMHRRYGYYSRLIGPVGGGAGGLATAAIIAIFGVC